MENLSKYQAFVTAASLGSFTKAAEKLNYTQSAISRMISDLESEWHMSLLERRKTGVSLTSDGLKLLPYAKELCEKQKALQMQVDALSGLESGMVRIGTFSSVATHRLPEILKIFGESYPNIEFEILLGDYTEIEDWIAEGRVDFGFLRLSARPEFEAVFLEQDEFLVVLPENHFLAQKRTRYGKRAVYRTVYLTRKGRKSGYCRHFRKMRPCAAHALYNVGRLCRHVHGGKGTRNQHFAGAYPKTRSVRNRHEIPRYPGIPQYRPCAAKPKNAVACGKKVRRIH